MSPLPQTYSLVELQAHPDMLLRLLPDAETRIIIERDGSGNNFVFIPSSKPSKQAQMLVAEAKERAQELRNSPLTPLEAKQSFLAMRDEFIQEIERQNPSND
jgi:hypothetical protein